MSPKHRLEMFRRLAAANPEPETELEYGSPYQLLAAVLMSAQATDKSVNLVTRRLFPLAPTPQAMVGLGLERITDTIRTIGLFRNKAKNLLAMSQILIDQHGGEVPDSRGWIAVTSPRCSLRGSLNPPGRGARSRSSAPPGIP